MYKLPVKAITPLTADCVSIEFVVEDHLKDLFDYKQGQYLTLRADVNGEDLRRCYSLCSSPLDQRWIVAVKLIPNGKFSTYVHTQLKVGDVLDVFPPDGKFYVDIDTNQKRNYVAFAAGSGITPILSIIKTHLLSEPKSSFKLFYVNQSTASIILKEELEALKNKYINRFELFYFLTQEERNIEWLNGRIDTDKLNIIFNGICAINEVDHFFICGPEPMIHLIDGHLTTSNVPKSSIHFELFGTDPKESDQKKKELKAESSDQACDVTIIEGGKRISFTMAQGSNNVLDAALDKEADLPYSCKGGVCASCKAKLLEGEVDMILSYGLDEEEIEAGYVLTCQSIPTSDRVVVDFDV